MSAKVSLGTRLYDRLDLPDGVSKWARHWSFAVMAAGVVIAFHGIGLDVELTSKLPFLKVSNVTSGTEVRPVILATGVMMMVVGLLLSLRLVPVEDRDIDRSWPRRGHDDPTPRLALISPIRADETLIAAALARHGRDWPTLAIDWPQSARTMLDELQRLQAKPPVAGDQAAVNVALRDIADVIATVEPARRAVAANLPALVDRCRHRDDPALVGIIRTYLMLANHHIMQPVAAMLDRFVALGIRVDIPAAWQVIGDRNRFAAQFHGEDRWQLVRRGVLVAIGGAPVLGRYGPGIDVFGPKTLIRHRIDSQNAIDRLIPQVELGIALDQVFVRTYAAPWLISRFGPPGTWMPVDFGGEETSEDPDALALAERLQREWQQQQQAAAGPGGRGGAPVPDPPAPVPRR